MRRLSSVDRVLLNWCVGVLCAVVMAFVALAVINRTVYDPAGQVRQYIQALEAGDGERALGISGASVPEKTGAAMLSGDALKNSMVGLENIEIRKTETLDGGDGARVTVSYTVDGEEKQSDFTLHKTGSHWGVFDQWSMDSVQLPTVNVEAKSVDAATLNGAKVNVSESSRSFAVFYPGEYRVTYESPLLSATEDVGVVTSSAENIKLDLGLKPSAAAQLEINHQTKAYLDNCASQNTLYPVGCPFDYDFSGRVQGDVQWRITKYPELTATINGKGAWSVKKAQGAAQVSFTQVNLQTGATSSVKKDVTFTVTTKVSAQNDDLSVTVQ